MRFIDIGERDNHIQELEAQLGSAMELYNERVAYLMTLSSFKSLVLATIDELSQRYLTWDD